MEIEPETSMAKLEEVAVVIPNEDTTPKEDAKSDIPTCCICLLPLEDDADTPLKKKKDTRLPCGHALHANCAARMLRGADAGDPDGYYLEEDTRYGRRRYYWSTPRRQSSVSRDTRCPLCRADPHPNEYGVELRERLVRRIFSPPPFVCWMRRTRHCTDECGDACCNGDCPGFFCIYMVVCTCFAFGTGWTWPSWPVLLFWVGLGPVLVFIAFKLILELFIVMCLKCAEAMHQRRQRRLHDLV